MTLGKLSLALTTIVAALATTAPVGSASAQGGFEGHSTADTYAFLRAPERKTSSVRNMGGGRLSVTGLAAWQDRLAGSQANRGMRRTPNMMGPAMRGGRMNGGMGRR